MYVFEIDVTATKKHTIEHHHKGFCFVGFVREFNRARCVYLCYRSIKKTSNQKCLKQQQQNNTRRRRLQQQSSRHLSERNGEQQKKAFVVEELNRKER